MTTTVAFVAVGVALAGCAASGRTVSRADMQSSWQIQYGVVEGGEQVQLKSRLPSPNALFPTSLGSEPAAPPVRVSGGQ